MASVRLSETSVSILQLIANGHSYAQIVDGQLNVTYADIFKAAAEALRLSGVQSDNDNQGVDLRELHPRAYMRWTAEEDERLLNMFHQRKWSVAQIAEELQRQPSSISSRLSKLSHRSVESETSEG